MKVQINEGKERREIWEDLVLAIKAAFGVARRHSLGNGFHVRQKIHRTGGEERRGKKAAHLGK